MRINLSPVGLIKSKCDISEGSSSKSLILSFAIEICSFNYSVFTFFYLEVIITFSELNMRKWLGISEYEIILEVALNKNKG